MVAGNAMNRKAEDTFESQAINFRCIDTTNTGVNKETRFIPPNSCNQGLRVQVFFPSCWDGKNFDFADHKSHLSYPALGNGNTYNYGVCLHTHPVQLVSIFYEVL
jgi:Domain of unknown function (DUF1996)